VTLRFSQRPGRHERHLRRRQDNPLFPEGARRVTPEALHAAQERDHEELVAFIGEFRGLVQRAVALRPTEESQVILELKESLDRAYEQASGLADDQGETRRAIEKLVGVVMTAVRAGAAGDPAALGELRQEEAARAAHFELLEQPLVADILHPASTIAPDELVPTLLSESQAAVAAALQLFDDAQLALLLRDARDAIERLDAEAPLRTRAAERLAMIERAWGDAAPGGR
jgi:hypothetical protein